ncbi:uncharacterized protein CLUP02_15656 [Colletotrichum lupini]|uniref:Uncharacterized protein n=1 Tax=Colletotrichum lupini TaxID=145971 RepID=A0A9Q8WPF1_9PEZI|nr:uncharacterized protein CLUP02_15656 [Colletotrichum lupini]UQC90125.1 hypothetical protein CLUP02_15656 [Colletotrichum lupini]
MSPNVSVPLFGLLLLLVAVSAFPSAWSLDSHSMGLSSLDWPRSTPVRRDVEPFTQYPKRDDDQDIQDTCNPFSMIQNFHEPIHRLYAQGYNVSLAKRVKLEVPGDDTDMDVWMRERTEITKPIVWEVSPGTDANTAIFRRFGRNSFSLGTNGLCGCSSLWIISRKGVYATHYWESISFAPEKEWRNPGETNAEVFERTVIDGLKSGIAVKGKPMQARLNRDEIADDHIKAYLIHPQRTWKNTPAAVEGYRVQWNRIKDTVKAIIPELASDDKWEEVIYNRFPLMTKRKRRLLYGLRDGGNHTMTTPGSRHAEILSFSEVVIRILEHHSHISDYSLQRIPHQEEAHWFQDHPFN